MTQAEPLMRRNGEVDDSMIKHSRLVSSSFSRILDCWILQQLEVLDVRSNNSDNNQSELQMSNSIFASSVMDKLV
jgi:hypothetical protein